MKAIQATTKSSDGIISRYLNRRISIYISKFFLRVYPEISPTTISFFCFFLALIGGSLFFFSLPFLGGIIIQLSSIIDGCDGEIARIKKKSSKTGAFLDSVLDRYADCFILIMVILYLQVHWSFPDLLPLMLVVGLLAIVGSMLISYTAAKSTLLRSCEFNRTIEGRDFRYFVLMIGGIAAFFWYFSLFITLLYLACITNIKVIQRVYHIRKQISQNKKDQLYEPIKH